MCVCVCVSERESESERERGAGVEMGGIGMGGVHRQDDQNLGHSFRVLFSLTAGLHLLIVCLSAYRLRRVVSRGPQSVSQSCSQLS